METGLWYAGPAGGGVPRGAGFRELRIPAKEDALEKVYMFIAMNFPMCYTENEQIVTRIDFSSREIAKVVCNDRNSDYG